jgi:hypothetical protein
MGKKQKNPEILTRGTKKIIANAIEKTGDFNRSTLCDVICDELCSKFSGDSLEYQLERMNLSTTKDINRAIDTYMFRHMKLNKLNTKNKKANDEE